MGAELVTAIVMAGIAIVGAAANYIVTAIKARATKTELASIKNALANANALYYVTCPTCGTKIYLKGENLKQEEKPE